MSNYQTIKLSFAKFIVQIGVTHHHSYTINLYNKTITPPHDVSKNQNDSLIV